MSVHIGTSGELRHWDGVLYPPGTSPRDRLAHYVARFRTVELNASFHRWPRDAGFTRWRRRLPPGFLLSVKAPPGADPGSLYGGSYGDADLLRWADRVGEWAGSGRDVYVYVNNDGDGHAVRNAERLRELVSG